MSEKTKILIALGILLIVSLLALEVIILIQYSANVIVKNAESDYLDNKDIEINNNTEDSTFTKTYNVLNIADSNDEKYIYLTIKQFQEEEVKTAKVQKSLANNIEIRKDYEFTFRYTDKKVEENIESIFTNATLVSIKKTDKQGLEQIQDSIR